MGQVPYLEVDDGKLSIGQTLAICRYLAKSLKASDYFGGATKSDAAKCDMYAETFMDFFTLGVERIFESDPDIKVLWCDLVAVAVLSMVEETKADLLQGFPDLRNYYTNMRNLPEIKDYVAQSWPPAASDEA
ncbi:hypothetical protein ANCCAN_23792 [Ancylostoma caninum]|uniref:GST N-terminal domain-containing protein n=1 Tax=Ancylostoma caninum TaxID=29170 RepID=A0A368FE28_ANCCA|nr:hypothetical protein ANCCAN_23792 [Ancylostoma caninum]